MMVSAGFKKARSSSDVVERPGFSVVGEKRVVSVLSSASKTVGGPVEDNISTGLDVNLLFVPTNARVLSVVDRNVFTCLLEFMAVVSLRASSSFFLCLVRPRIL
jgi:hypothetical protein